MIDELVTLGIALVTGVFGAGAAYASMRGDVRAARLEAQTATQQANAMIGKLSEMEKLTDHRMHDLSERTTRVEEGMKLHAERIANVREKADGMVSAEVYKAETRAQTAAFVRSISERSMPSSRIPVRDERHESDDPGPMRPRLPSRRQE